MVFILTKDIAYEIKERGFSSTHGFQLVTGPITTFGPIKALEIDMDFRHS